MITTSLNGSDPAFLAGVPDADYRNATGLAQSSLKEFLVSPAHYLASTEVKKEPTKAMILGTAFHALMLQDDPTKFFAVKEKMDGRTKEGRAYNEEFAIENAGKAIIDADEYATICAMKKSVLAHPLASRLHFALTHKEVAVFGTSRPAGGEVRLKGMIDGYSATEGFALDYKSAEDASPAGARKAIWDRRYDIQEVQYRWLLDANGKVCNEFYFILVEKIAPYAVGVYTLSKHSRDKTTQLWENSIHDFAICQSSGKYPAYSDSSVEVNL